MRSVLPLLLSCVLLLNACGNTRLERVGSGAAIGGGIGFASGAVCCQDPPNGIKNGFFIGAAVGALIGLMLDHPLFFDTSSR